MVEAYIGVITILIAVMGPVTIATAIFLWHLYGEDRSLDTREPKPRLRLSLVLAVEATMTATGAAYLALAVVSRFLGHALPTWLAPITVTVILALEIVPVLSAVYLRWLRRYRSRNGGTAHPPPWGKDD